MMNSYNPIRWREPFRARAHHAREEIRRGWLFIVVRGVSIPLVGTILLVIWCRSLDEPIRPALPLLLLLIGVMLTVLLTMERFIPHAIRFGQSSIFLSGPRTVEWIRYTKLVRCEISSPPYPHLFGFGQRGQILFAIYLDPRIDMESLYAFLSEKGVTLQRGAAEPAAIGPSAKIVDGTR